MRIGTAPCCSNAYGPNAGRWRIVVVLAGAVMFVIGGIYGTRGGDAPIPLIRDSIVVSERSPRAVATQHAGPFTVRVSDMRDQLSLVISNREGSTVSPGLVDVHAWYSKAGEADSPVPLATMNDHFMATIDPAQAGTLTLALRTRSENERVSFELPVRAQEEAP